MHRNSNNGPPVKDQQQESNSYQVVSNSLMNRSFSPSHIMH